MPRRSAKTMRRRVKSASKKMAQSVRMRRGAPAKKNVPKKKTQKAKKSKSGSIWNQQVMAAFAELRAKNPKATLAEAMSLAAARRDARHSAPGGKEKSSVTIPRRPLSALPILEQKKKKTLSPVKSARSSEFSVVSAPKPKKQKAKKTKKKKMTPPPIPPNKKGQKIPSKKGKKSSKKKQAPKWATYYGKDGTERPFLNPEYSPPKTFGSATE